MDLKLCKTGCSEGKDKKGGVSSEHMNGPWCTLPPADTGCAVLILLTLGLMGKLPRTPARGGTGPHSSEGFAHILLGNMGSV